MKYKFEPHSISKKNFYNLNEDNLMFITNPGRMGDEDGSTFIIKIDDNYIPYRIDGWMYPDKGKRNSEDYISLDDMLKVFPKWKDSWHNYYEDKNYNGKYTYIYMGFGNGLCVDKRIYDKYYHYLLEEIKKETKEIDENNNYDCYLNYSYWVDALINMILADGANIDYNKKSKDK